MANLQYIGARYVPKFFMNPDDQSNDWKSGVLYEALTIVTYNNDSYTSKITVPDTIGNPADNPQFWACTTKYTAALVALQTTVGNLEDLIGDPPLDTVAQTIIGAINEIKPTFVTPEMYGAKGDGLTNDSGAINTAIATGLKVVFDGAKTYFCNDYLRIVDGSQLVGNGAHIVFAEDTALYNTSHIIGEAISNILIDGFDFNFGNHDTLVYGISIFDSEFLTIKNCVFHDNNGYIFRCNRDHFVKFICCDFYDVTGDVGNPGGAIYGQDWQHLVIDNCTARDIYDHFCYITGNTNDVKISKCTVIGAGRGENSPGSAYCIYANSSDVVIANCSDINCLKGGVHIAVYGEYESSPHEVLITGHYSYNNSQNAIEGWGDTTRPLKNITITDCMIEAPYQDGIAFHDGSNIIVSNCTIKNLQRANRAPIKFEAFSNILIKGCMIDTPNNYGIQLGAPDKLCFDVVVAENMFNAILAKCIYPRNMTDPVYAIGNYAIDNADLYQGKVCSTGQGVKTNDQRTITFGDVAESVNHQVGDIIYNPTPSVGNPIGWVCTVGGNPGTFVAMANL